MKYASVCSGVEAASLAWMPLGWEAAWFSEIEPFPCAVLKERFPNVPNLGDMTRITMETMENGDQLYRGADGTTALVSGGVDLLVGGTPCQGFSVAGKQGGLEDERSVLCLTFINLLKIMQPRFFVWENVPGVLSTAGGADFFEFIRQVTESGYCCSWRILDAQYVRVDGYPRAVPQRRRRMFVVGHLGTDWGLPAEILFEPYSLLGDSPPRRVKGKGFTSDVERSVGTAGRDGCISLIPYGTRLGAHENGIASTIARIDAKFPQCVCTTDRPWDESGVNPTLNQELFSQNFNGLLQETFASSSHGGYAAAAAAAGTLKSSGGDIGGGSENLATFQNGDDVTTTLTEAFADDRMQDQQAVTCFAVDQGAGKSSCSVSKQLSPTLATTHGGEPAVICLNDQGGSVMQVERSGASGCLRADTHGNEQIVCVHGAETPISNTEGFANPVTANHDGLENVICYENHGQDSRIKELNEGGNNLPSVQECYVKTAKPRFKGGSETYVDTGVAPTVNCFDQGDKRANELVCEAVAIAENIIGRQVQNGGNGTGAQEELAYTQNTSGVMGVAHYSTVRRLLPVECERLMGFPDNWTRIPWKGKPEEDCPDSPRYKACGNSMCVNVMRWIGTRIQNAIKEKKDER